MVLSLDGIYKDLLQVIKWWYNNATQQILLDVRTIVRLESFKRFFVTYYCQNNSIQSSSKNFFFNYDSFDVKFVEKHIVWHSRPFIISIFYQMWNTCKKRSILQSYFLFNVVKNTLLLFKNMQQNKNILTSLLTYIGTFSFEYFFFFVKINKKNMHT